MGGRLGGQPLAGICFPGIPRVGGGALSPLGAAGGRAVQAAGAMLCGAPRRGLGRRIPEVGADKEGKQPYLLLAGGPTGAVSTCGVSTCARRGPRGAPPRATVWGERGFGGCGHRESSRGALRAEV